MTDWRTKYQVDCVVSIDTLQHSASNSLYQQLVPWQKTQYPNDYRFVFENFAPVNLQTLEHVLWTINYLDISPYFVLIATNQTLTQEFFNAHDIHCVLTQGQATQPTAAVEPLFNINNDLCAYAWAGMHVFPDGTAAPCCDYSDVIRDAQGQIMDIRSHSFEDIVNSDYMKHLRSQFRQGQRPEGCRGCFQLQDQGAQSRKSLAPYKLRNVYAQIKWENDEAAIGFLGSHLGNLCNLKCRICSADNSSSIAAENLRLIPVNEIKQSESYQLLKNNSWYKRSDHFWSQLRQHVPTLCNFEFLGGEPLLLQEHLDFLQYLIDSGHSTGSVIELVTNGSRYPQLFDQADLFKRFTVTISVDNVGDRFELERHGCRWERVTDTVSKFVARAKQSQNLNVGINVTVSIQNILYLEDIINWIDQSQVDHYELTVLEHPEYLSVDQLTKPAQQLVLDTLLNTKFASKHQHKIDHIIAAVKNAATSDGKEFCEFMKVKDQLRQENFGATHAKIAKAMGYFES